jgi:hypothetical protein
MKLRNSTDWPDHFLRRMASWVCRELGYPVDRLKTAQFTKASCASRGRACESDILVRIGSASHFPQKSLVYKGQKTPDYADREEALVGTTAHEIAHLIQFWQFLSGAQVRRNKRLEPAAVATEHAIMATFRSQRESILAAWSAEPVQRQRKDKPSLQEQRAAKVAAALNRWQRKLKLAKTKVKQYRRNARYYESAIAAKGSA